jgi:hypothetical protein
MTSTATTTTPDHLLKVSDLSSQSFSVCSTSRLR